MREGHGLPLHHVCPNREACWAGVPPEEQPPVAEHWDEDKSGVSIRDEFSILDPRVLVLLGRTNAAWRVRDELDEQLHREHRPGFDRFLGRLRGQPIEVLCCDHPSDPRWRTRSLRSLTQSLAEQRLRT